MPANQSQINLARLYGGSNAVNSALANPAVDAAAIIADEKALALNRFDQMQMFGAMHAHQHDIASRQCAAWPDRRALPLLYRLS